MHELITAIKPSRVNITIPSFSKSFTSNLGDFYENRESTVPPNIFFFYVPFLISPTLYFMKEEIRIQIKWKKEVMQGVRWLAGIYLRKKKTRVISLFICAVRRAAGSRRCITGDVFESLSTSEVSMLKHKRKKLGFIKLQDTQPMIWFENVIRNFRLKRTRWIVF